MRPELREQEGDAAVARRLSVAGRWRSHHAERIQTGRNEYI
jgi:hypothetical protein